MNNMANTQQAEEIKAFVKRREESKKPGVEEKRKECCWLANSIVDILENEAVPLDIVDMNQILQGLDNIRMLLPAIDEVEAMEHCGENGNKYKPPIWDHETRIRTPD